MATERITVITESREEDRFEGLENLAYWVGIREDIDDWDELYSKKFYDEASARRYAEELHARHHTIDIVENFA